MCKSIESCEVLDCGRLFVGCWAPGTGEGGAKAKDALVALDAIELSESRRRRVGEAGQRGVLEFELVAIQRKGAFGVTNWPGSGTETTRDFDTFPLDVDVEALVALKVRRTASGPEMVPRRWCSRGLAPGRGRASAM